MLSKIILKISEVKKFMGHHNNEYLQWLGLINNIQITRLESKRFSSPRYKLIFQPAFLEINLYI